MPISVPDNPKVLTTIYDNFKGVDFTNDATNVWRRRSPDAVNMLPDAAGRPFKRNGWEILISNEEICEYLEVESCSIQKCAWFELGGKDHLAIFTDCGVAFYNGEFTDKSSDYDCYSGYDRCFFFEGNGMAAFYIYGNFKVWRYESDFNLHDVTELITVPSVLIGADARGAGTPFDGYNLLGAKAAVEYNDTNLWAWWSSDNLQVFVSDDFKTDYGQATVDEETFNANKTSYYTYDGENYIRCTEDSVYSSETTYYTITGKTINEPAEYRYEWDGDAWVDKLETGVAFNSAQISVMNEPQIGDEIVIVYGYGVMIPTNVSTEEIGNGFSVRISLASQFDYEMPVVADPDTLESGYCKLWTDDTANRTNGQAWVQFHSSDVERLVKPLADGEDYIKVIFSSVVTTKKEYADVVCAGAAALVEG